MWTENTKIARSDKTPWQIIENKALLLSPGQSMAHELNETATWIWINLEERISYQKLLLKYHSQFATTMQVAESDLIELLDDMKSKKLIRCW